jgi:hypothetical protein
MPAHGHAQELGSSTHPIVNGIRTPEVVNLTDGEIMAIGWISERGAPDSTFCTGTLITSRIVISAKHCFVNMDKRYQFGLGRMPNESRFIFDIEAIEIHPREDIALVFLTEDAVDAVPDLTPIRANRHTLDGSEGELVLERAIQAGGYGDTLSEAKGRFFTSVVLAEITSTYVIVDGQGASGLCRGDSGSGVITTNTLGYPVILGVEHAGDASCVDRDQLTRLDLPGVRDWIEQGIASTRDFYPDGGPCRGVDYLGRCVGSMAEWCEVGRLKRRDCAPEGRICAFVDRDSGYFCGPRLDCTPGELDCFGIGYGRDGFTDPTITGVAIVGACSFAPGAPVSFPWLLLLPVLAIRLRRR